MIIIAGYLRVAAHDRDKYLAGVAPVADLARRAPGCQEFVQAGDPNDPGRIIVYERWDDDESLRSFREIDDPSSQASPLPDVLDADVAKYRISAIEPP